MDESIMEDFELQYRVAAKLCENLVRRAERMGIHPVVMYTHILLLLLSYERIIIETGMLNPEEIKNLRREAEESVKQASSKEM